MSTHAAWSDIVSVLALLLIVSFNYDQLSILALLSHSRLSFPLPLTALCTSRSTKLAVSLGCKSNPAKLEECLQQADPGKITSMQNEAVTQPAHLGLIFVPTVDGVFLTDSVEVDLQLCSCCSYI